MKNILFKNIVMASVYIGLLLVVDFVTLKFGKVHLFGYAFKVVLIIFFATFLFINRQLFIKVNNANVRFLLIVILCVLITFLFGLLAFTIAVNFHLAIGGSL